MRLPAKNATARVVALALAAAGTHAAAQSIMSQELPRLPDSTLPSSGAATRPAALPEGVRSPRAAALQATPPARERERSAPDAEASRFRSDAALRGADWAGTPYSLLAETLPRLPVRVTSPIARALTLEILTAPADPAAGPRLAARLALLRAERLYAMGRLEAADAAFRAAAPFGPDRARAPAEIETKLLLLGHRAACEAVASHLAVRNTPYLARADVACHAMAGAHGKAALALGSLRERGIAMGDVFVDLVMAQQPELARPLGMIGGADAWSIRLLAETKLPWPEDAMRLGSPALLQAVARSGNEPIAVRIGAAERAFLLGVLDRPALVTLYGAVRFRDSAFRHAERLPLAQYSPLKRALLFQAAMRAPDPRVRIEILSNWWRLARADRSEPLAALVTAPLVIDLRPGAEWRENAAALSRVFFHAGELDRALAWYGWLGAATFKDAESHMRLGAIAQLADTGGNGWTVADAGTWAAYQRGQAAGARRIALLRALEEGLGAKQIEALVAGKAARVEDERAAGWREAETAARAGRRGEAILLMLTALGHDGVARSEPRALGAAVGVLATLGRQAEARRFAVEAALANGF